MSAEGGSVQSALGFMVDGSACLRPRRDGKLTRAALRCACAACCAADAADIAETKLDRSLDQICNMYREDTGIKVQSPPPPFYTDEGPAPPPPSQKMVVHMPCLHLHGRPQRRPPSAPMRATAHNTSSPTSKGLTTPEVL